MKERLMLLFMMGMLGIRAYAQTPPPPTPAANVNGSAIANTSLTFGNQNSAGGFNNGQAGSIFNVSDPTLATANANSSVAGTGTVTPSMNSLAAGSLFGGQTAVSIGGNVSNFTSFLNGTQSNWATLSLPNTLGGQDFSTAGNLTYGELVGTLSNPSGPDSANGTALINMNGNSAVTLVQTPTSVQTTAMTQGSGLATMTFTGNNATIAPFVGSTNGNAMIGGQGIVQDPTGNMFAGSSMQGIAGFNVPNAFTSSIGGSFKLNGATSAAYGPGSTQASASMTTTSTTNH